MELELQHVNAKIYVDGELQLDLQRVIEVFHRWTAQQSLDEMLIDVADYRHVPAGPSVVLVGHEADYVMDNGDNRYGLLYNRKARLDGENADRLQQALRAAAHACTLLEAEFPGKLRFSRQEFELLINDRALAPNTAETFQSCQGEITGTLSALLGHSDFELAHNGDPRRRFGVRVKVSRPYDLAVFASAAS